MNLLQTKRHPTVPENYLSSFSLETSKKRVRNIKWLRDAWVPVPSKFTLDYSCTAALQDLFCLFLVHYIGIETTKNILAGLFAESVAPESDLLHFQNC
jgi:hypothetical protein